MSTPITGQIPNTDPREPVPWDPQDRAALIAVKECRASPDQLKLFMVWFIKATAVTDMEFRLDDRLSAFAGGKRWVGSQFFSIVDADIKEVTK